MDEVTPDQQPVVDDNQSAAAQPDTTTQTSVSGGDNWAVKRSVVRVIVLTILSGGLYGLYWFYVTRQQLFKELGQEDQATLHTLGLFVPLLNIYLIYLLWRDINEVRVKAGLEGFEVILYLLLAIFVPVVNVIIYAVVISKYNEYWDKKSNGQATDAKVTGNEIIVTVAGLIVTVLFYIFIIGAALFGAKKVNDISKDYQKQVEQTTQDYQKAADEAKKNAQNYQQNSSNSSGSSSSNYNY